MNPVDPAATDTPVEIITNSDPKPGLKSTEFWMIAAANVIAVVLAMLGKIEAQWAVGTVTVLNALYAVLRNQLKTATAKEAGKSLFTWLLIGSLTFGGLPSCTTVTTRTIAPDGTVTESVTESADSATIGTIASTAASIAQARADARAAEEAAAKRPPAAVPVDRTSSK